MADIENTIFQLKPKNQNSLKIISLKVLVDIVGT